MFLCETALSASSYYKDIISIVLFTCDFASLLFLIFVLSLFDSLFCLIEVVKRVKKIEKSPWTATKKKRNKTYEEDKSGICRKQEGKLGRERQGILRTNRTTRCYFIFCTLPPHIFLSFSISLVRSSSTKRTYVTVTLLMPLNSREHCFACCERQGCHHLIGRRHILLTEGRMVFTNFQMAKTRNRFSREYHLFE